MQVINKPFSFKKLTIGSASGEDEADYLTDFENYFYDHDNYSTKVLEPNIYFVIGRKGTGKSLLAKYVEKMHKKSQQSYRKFTKIVSFQNFRYQQLIEFGDKTLLDKEYFYIWRWCLLLNMAILLVKDESVQDIDSKNKIASFLDKNFGLDLNQKNIFDRSKKIKYSLGFSKSTQVSYETSFRQADGTYLDYIEEFQELVVSLGKTSQSDFCLFFDDLDDGFEVTELYEKSMGSLIYAVDDLNRIFWRSGFKAKCVLLMRSDIFRILNFPDLNKFKMDNSLVLDWRPEEKEHSPLISLLIHKILVSLGLTVSENDYARVFFELFDDRIEGRHSYSWMLDMTMARPRDLVQMIKIICDEFPNYSHFSGLCFQRTKGRYSQYLYDDVRNEMSGHKDKAYIEKSLSLLKGLGKRNTLTLEILKKKKPYHFKSDDGEEDVISMLFFLYRFSVLGNIYSDIDNNSNVSAYAWAHKEDQVEPDYNITFTIHNGLRLALKAGKANKSLNPTA